MYLLISLIQKTNSVSFSTLKLNKNSDIQIQNIHSWRMFKKILCILFFMRSRKAERFELNWFELISNELISPTLVRSLQRLFVGSKISAACFLFFFTFVEKVHRVNSYWLTFSGFIEAPCRITTLTVHAELILIFRITYLSLYVMYIINRFDCGFYAHISIGQQA